jgi:hypothetical protein
MRHNEHLGSVRTGQVYDEPEDKGVIDVLACGTATTTPHCASTRTAKPTCLLSDEEPSDSPT